MRIVIRAAAAALLLAVAGPTFSAALMRATQASALPVAGRSHVSARLPHGGSHSRRRRAPVGLHVDIGYNGQSRGTAWTPVRVTVQNRTDATINGTIQIDDSSNGGPGPPRDFHTAYTAAAVLPDAATKQFTLYLPGADAEQSLDVSVRDGTRILATATTSASDFGDATVSTAVLVDDPGNARWLNTLGFYAGGGVRLTPATLDPYPQALGNFDIIVLTNTNSSLLGPHQVFALKQFVRNGGSLVLVGGRDWQETLEPLPTGLLPGRLVGTRTLSSLRGLTSLGKVPVPKNNQPVTVSVLSDPRGTVLARESGIPLAVLSSLGSGHILYLAFDPMVAPVPQWGESETKILTRLMTLAAPMAMDRQGYPNGFQTQQIYGGWGPWGPADIGSELSNVPAAALPSLILFIVLAISYILLLGPANFVVLRRLGRPELSWITIPVLAALCVGSTFSIAFRLKGDTALINTVGIVDLSGSDSHRPATFYVGLFAPVRGDYNLTYSAPALASGLSTASYYSAPGTVQNNVPLTLRIRQGAQTDVGMLGVNMWSMRNVKLQTTVDVPGSVTSNLTVDARGNIVGTIHNGTKLDLLHPAVVAGRGMTHLPDIPAGRTVHVVAHPSNDLFDQTPLWLKLYGDPNYQGPRFFGRGIVFFGSNGGKFFNSQGPSLPSENNVGDRIKNVATMLPEGPTLSFGGEVELVAWTEQPLGSFSVDGSAPHRRDLNLIMSPLSVHISAGPFRLREGALEAHLVDIAPHSVSNCCPGPPTGKPIMLGVGGWATFEFDVPHTRHLHFRHLTLSVNAGGRDGSDIGHVYDWHARTWRPIDLTTGDASLPNPDRFVSPGDAILLKLKATNASTAFGTDIQIMDLRQNIQISGSGVAT